MIQISADRQRARCVRSANERITTGLTGKTVAFQLGEGWENVTARTAVFEGSGVTKDCLIENGMATIPHECLTVPGGVLRCGIYGVEGDKKTPTVYAELGQIERGADPSGDTSTDPTLAVWAQILAKMGSLDDLTTEAKNTLVAAINEAANSGGDGGDGGYLWRPTVSEAGEISWERSKSTTAPEAENIKGPKGDPGTPGDTFANKAVLERITGIVTSPNTVNEPGDILSWQAALVAFLSLNNLRIQNPTAGIYPRVASVDGDGMAIWEAADKNALKEDVVSALGYTPEDAANKTTGLSASSTDTQYPSAKAVWDSIPHPEAKTDAMTQAVGKDADGKLWTAPGGGSGGEASSIELVYTWTADGTTMSAIDDLTIEPGKLYFCETIVPQNGDLSANVQTPAAYVRIGTAGNTYTGMIVGTVAGQQKYSILQSRWTFFVLGGTIHSVSDRIQAAQNVPTNAAYAANKIYIYSTTSDVNIISGTTVNIYKMG